MADLVDNVVDECVALGVAVVSETCSLEWMITVDFKAVLELIDDFYGKGWSGSQAEIQDI